MELSEGIGVFSVEGLSVSFSEGVFVGEGVVADSLLVSIVGSVVEVVSFTAVLVSEDGLAFVGSIVGFVGTGLVSTVV